MVELPKSKMCQHLQNLVEIYFPIFHGAFINKFTQTFNFHLKQLALQISFYCIKFQKYKILFKNWFNFV